MTNDVCVTNEANQNLTPSQKEILRWHFRLGYIGFQHVQWLIRTGRLKVQGNSKAVVNCERPTCAACEFGKGHCRPNKVNKTKKNPMKERDLKKDHLKLRITILLIMKMKYEGTLVSFLCVNALWVNNAQVLW